MNFSEQLTDDQLDLLKEIGNIGSGNAATSLSELLHQKVGMTVPSVQIVGFDETMEIVGGPDELIVCIFLRVQGYAPGSMFLVLSPNQAEHFVHQIIGDNQFSFKHSPYDEMSVSLLHELGNILVGSYLSALSDFTSINMQPSVPALSVDMAGAILSQGLIELSKQGDYAIVIETTINDSRSGEESIKSHFFLLPDPDSFEKIFSALGVNNNG